MIDLHNHFLIDVDDGPDSKEDALALLIQAEEQGITDIIATPHHHSMDWFTPKNIVLSKIDEIRTIISENGLSIKVHPGQEIRINENLLSEFDDDINLSLNHSRYVLIEFPFSDVPYFAEQLLYDLQMKGFTPIIAHPERCKPLLRSPDKIYNIVSNGSLTQVTCSSITGRLGEDMQETSLKMIKHNLVHFIASDAHDAELRPFELKDAYEVIEKRLGIELVERLKFNAQAVMLNQDVKIKAPKTFEVSYSNKRRKKKKKFLSLFL
ncbi:hypothetical protein ERX27_10575 [Macrococcus brunensis]|uniref:Tyrosine-protein phosphatase n=1 Tax=Macrococcus brunensis TaxID=198483 RepID=A0A4R6BAS4_9STAP|nr:CpsB/CapC family capsule biosynthesis tyrosine phosphatase [Macrococcus brunensis]TDL93400.1 hypothetical protein ERX27_10575 [Macrococcus brunensis]